MPWSQVSCNVARIITLLTLLSSAGWDQGLGTGLLAAAGEMAWWCLCTWGNVGLDKARALLVAAQGPGMIRVLDGSALLETYLPGPRQTLWEE